MTDQQNPPGTEFTPYELLFRWNDAGQLQGAHCQWLGKLKAPDGSVLASQPMPIEPVAMGEERGFPLASILDRALVDALKELDRLKAELEQSQQRIEELEFSIRNANAVIVDYQYRVDQLQLNLESQQGTSNEDGNDRAGDTIQSAPI